MITSLSNLQPGKSYRVQLSGVKPDGTRSEWTNTYTITTGADSAHPAPTVAADPFTYANGDITISWTDPTFKPDFSYYLVVVGTDTGINFSPNAYYNVNRNTSFTLTKEENDRLFANPDPTLTFRIYSIDKSEQLSDTVFVEKVSDYPALGGTITLVAKPIPNGIKYEWTQPNDPATVSHYDFQVIPGASAPDMNSAPEAIVIGNEFLYVGTAGTQYTAEIRANSIFGATLDSNPVTDTSGEIVAGSDSTAPTFPSLPTGVVTISDITTDKAGIAGATASWPAATDTESGVAGYMVSFKKSTDPGTDRKFWHDTYIARPEPTTADDRKFRINGLLPSTAYNVEVFAIDAATNISDPIGIADTDSYIFTTAAAPAASDASDSLVATWTTPVLQLTWNDVADAYRMQYEVDITVGAVTQTFIATDNKLSISPEDFKAKFPGAAPSIDAGNIKLYTRSTSSVRNTNPRTTTQTQYKSAWTSTTVSGLSLSVGNGSIDADWSDLDGAVSYLVEGNPGSGYSNIAKVNDSQHSFPAQVSAPTDNYTVRVSATDAFGRQSATTTSATSPPLTPDLQTAGLEAQAGIMAATWTVTGTPTLPGHDPVKFNVYAEENVTVGQAPTAKVASTEALTASWQTVDAVNWNVQIESVNGVGTATKDTDVRSINSVTTSTDTNPPDAVLASEITATAVRKPQGLFDIKLSWPTYIEPIDFYRFKVEWGTATHTYTQYAWTVDKSYVIEDLPRSLTDQYFVNITAYDRSGNFIDGFPTYPQEKGPIDAISDVVPVPEAWATPVWDTPNLILSFSDPNPKPEQYDVVFYELQLSTDAFATVTETWNITRTGDTETLVLTPEDIKDRFGVYQGSFDSGELRVRSVADNGDVSNWLTYNLAFSNVFSGQTTLSVTKGIKSASATWTSVVDAVSYELYSSPDATVTVGDTLKWSGSALGAYWQEVTSLRYIGVIPKNIYGTYGTMSAAQSVTPDAEAAIDSAAPTWATPGTAFGTPVFNEASQTWSLPVDFNGASDASDPLTYVLNYSISGNRTVSNVEQTLVKISGGGPYTITIPNLISGDVVSASMVVRDKFGNTTAASTVSGSGTIPADTTAPAAPSIDSVAWNSAKDGIDIQFDAAATHPADLARYELLFNSSTTKPSSSRLRRTIPTPSAGSLNQTFKLTKDDLLASGLTLNASVQIYVWLRTVDTSGNEGITDYGGGIQYKASGARGAGTAINATFSVINNGDTVSGTWPAVAGASEYRVYFGPTTPPTEFVSKTNSTNWKLQFIENTNYYYQAAFVDGLTGVETKDTVPEQKQITKYAIGDSGANKTIGGWTITDTSIHSNNLDDSVGLTTASITDPSYADKTVRIWAGAAPGAPASGKFKVYDDGAVLASEGRIGGWGILKNDILSTSDSSRAVWFPGVIGQTWESISTINLGDDQRSNIKVRVAAREWATGADGEIRIIAARRDSSDTTGASVEWAVGLDHDGQMVAYRGTTKIAAAIPQVDDALTNFVSNGEFIWLNYDIDRPANTVYFRYADGASLEEPTSWTTLFSVAYSGNNAVPASRVYLGGDGRASKNDVNADTYPFVGLISDLIEYGFDGGANVLLSTFRGSDIDRDTHKTGQFQMSATADVAGLNALEYNSLIPNGEFTKLSALSALTVSSISGVTNGVRTVTTSTEHGFSPGDKVDISGVVSTPAAETMNETGAAVISVPSTTTFTYAPSIGLAETRSSGGTIRLSDGWIGSSGAVIRSNDNWYTTPASALLGTVQNDTLTSALAPISPSRSYVASICHDRTITFTVKFYDSTKAYLSTSDESMADVAASGTWTSTELPFVSPSNAAYVQIVVTQRSSGTASYVDCVRLDSGLTAKKYLVGYSVVDSIRLESYGSMNVVNDYGRIEMTNRQPNEDSATVPLGEGTGALSPSIRLLSKTSSERNVSELPAEITVAESDAAEGATLIINSGALYDGVGIDAKRKSAEIKLETNTNPLADKTSYDISTNPTTALTLKADAVGISASNTEIDGKLSVAGSVDAGRIFAQGRAVGAIRGYGTFNDYSEFSAEADKWPNMDSNNFAIYNGKLMFYDPILSNTNSAAVNLENAEDIAGWTGTSVSLVAGGLGSMGYAQGDAGSAMTTDFIPMPITATYGQYWVDFYFSQSVAYTGSQTVAYIDEYDDSATPVLQQSIALNLTGTNTPGEWLRYVGEHTADVDTTQIKLRLVGSGVTGGDSIYAAKISTRLSEKYTATPTVAIDTGTDANLVTASAALFDENDIGRKVTIVGAGPAAADLTTTLSAISSNTVAFITDAASTTVTTSAITMYDPLIDTPLLNSFIDNGDVVGPPGPATDWSVNVTEAAYGVPASASVTGQSPNNTLELVIPEAPPTFAQIAVAEPVARAQGDLWYNPAVTPTVSALDISGDEAYEGTNFDTGLRLFDSGLETARIWKQGQPQFTDFAFSARSTQVLAYANTSTRYRNNSWVIDDSSYAPPSTVFNPGYGWFIAPYTGLYHVDYYASIKTAGSISGYGKAVLWRFPSSFSVFPSFSVSNGTNTWDSVGTLEYETVTNAVYSDRYELHINTTVFLEQDEKMHVSTEVTSTSNSPELEIDYYWRQPKLSIWLIKRFA